ncbi:MAG: hypothetical protein JW880_08155 [Candidatus Thermoplasmatota archaeon]|nr:hypothetical protein [Candidatus Thermoplasmatota archaeon]
MNRKLAVPLAVSREKNRVIRTRILKDSQDVDDIKVLATLAENRLRLERLIKDLEEDQDFYETEDTTNELDYIKASIQLGLLEMAGELEGVPTSEEILEEAVA